MLGQASGTWANDLARAWAGVGHPWATGPKMLGQIAHVGQHWPGLDAMQPPMLEFAAR